MYNHKKLYIKILIILYLKHFNNIMFYFIFVNLISESQFLHLSYLKNCFFKMYKIKIIRSDFAVFRLAKLPQNRENRLLMRCPLGLCG